MDTAPSAAQRTFLAFVGAGALAIGAALATVGWSYAAMGAQQRAFDRMAGERLDPARFEPTTALDALQEREARAVADLRRQSEEAQARARRLIAPTWAAAVAGGALLLFVAQLHNARAAREVDALRESEGRLRRGKLRQRLLASFGEGLGEGPDDATTIGRLVRTVVPDLADVAAVVVVDDAGAPGHVDAYGRDPATVAAFRELCGEAAPERDVHGAGIGRVLATGRPEYFPVVLRGLLDALTRTPDLRRRLAGLRLLSLCFVPLAARGRTIGVAVLATNAGGRRLNAGDCEALRQLATRAAIAIDNARLVGTASRTAALLESVLCALPDPLCVVDPGGHLRYVSAGCSRILGVSRTAMIGKRWRDLGYDPDLAAELDEKRREVLATGAVARVEARVQTATGRVDLEILMAPLRDGGDEIDGVVVASRDVTERNRADEERERLVRGLAEEAEAHERFLAMASHDVKTPLGALRLNVQMLLRQARSPDREVPAWIVEKLARIDQQLTRSIQLLEDILDVARLREGRLVLRLEDVDLTAVAQEVAARFGEQARAAGTSITVAGESSLVGLWDRLRLEQVVSNLVSNAIKYGGGEPVELVCSARGDHAVLEVRDHGPGIQPELRAEIFEPYRGAGERRGSFGLGLWIVHQVVGALGGGIEVDETPGGGTTFRVELPKRRARQTAEAERGEAA